MVKVYGLHGILFESARWVDEDASESIQIGDWVVIDGILQQFDQNHLPANTRWDDIIRVKKPNWKYLQK